MADEPREFLPKEPPTGDGFVIRPKDPPPAQAGPAPEPLPPLRRAAREPETLAFVDRPPRRRGSRRMLLGGVAAAAVIGVVMGVFARPELAGPSRPMQPAPSAMAPPAAGPQMQVAVQEPRRDAAVAPAAAETAPQAAEGLARTGPLAAATPPASPPPRAAAEPAAPQAAPRSAAPERPAPEPDAELAAAEPPRPRARPSFDCGFARSLSEELVCADPELAAADRRLSRAYERAVAAGVPRRFLREEQDDWLHIRETAARRAGPGAVADVYDQRIAELNDMAAEAEDRGY